MNLKAALRPFYFAARKLFARQVTFPDLAYSTSMYFSQFGEDVFVDQVFLGKKLGFYVDVGAYHPYNVSNTAFFYKTECVKTQSAAPLCQLALGICTDSALLSKP